jgi:cytosine/adenosine deaminase-related metal-dependent hydrolase
VSVRVVAAPWLLAGRGGRAIADAAVALDGDRVVAAGPRAAVEARHGRAEAVDAVLLPAFANAHTHLELSHLAGQVPGGDGLAPWVRRLLAARSGAGGPGAGVAAAIAALERHGVAAVGDVSNTLAALPALRAAGLLGSVFHEVVGFTRERVGADLARADERLLAAGDPGPGLRVLRSPHGVYSTHPEVVARLLAAGPASIHLAEDPAERELCARAAGPFAEMNRALGAPDLAPFARSPAAAVAAHLRPGSLCVHCVDLDGDDVALLAASGATAVLCPRSNLHVGGRLPDLPRLLAAGVPLAVGTDSLASSPSLAPLAEVAALAAAFPRVDRARLLELAWNGAAVGAPEVGAIAPGAAPGIVAAALDGAPPADPVAWLLGEPERAFGWIARPRPAAGRGAAAPRRPVEERA